MAFKTQYSFRLPRGYVDEDGKLHRDGVMRLATARDEILPLQDYRVQSNRAYLVICCCRAWSPSSASTRTSPST